MTGPVAHDRPGSGRGHHPARLTAPRTERARGRARGSDQPDRAGSGAGGNPMLVLRRDRC